MGRHLIRILAVVLIVAGLAAGCSGYRTARDANIAEQQGNWDEAVLRYLDLVSRHPDNVSYRTGLMRAKIKASQLHFDQGKDFHEAGSLQRALQEYQQAVQLDPSNQYALVELEKLRIEIAEARRDSSPSLTIEEMKAKNAGSSAQPPVLNPRSNAPISLSFPRPVSTFDIYRALGRAFGINVLFDPKLRDQEIAIELEEVVAQDSLEILMRAANHFYKVLDEHTIIVAEDNPQNRRNYEDLVIQTFFLSNAEVKDVMTMLRSLVGAKNIAANDQLNAIVLRDSADKVKVAERIIRTNDKSRGELVVDVELLQIATNKMQELGVELSSYSVTQQIDPTRLVADTGGIRLSDIGQLNQADWIVTIPSFIYNFMKSNTEAQLLASPQVRISDGEKATLHIGDRVPIPVTTFNTGSTIGGNIVPITSFQYQDVGIRLDIEPRIHHNKEVTLKLQVEVSALSGSVQGSGGQQQPIIATRNVESTIRLMDGETNFLAGLIRTDESVTDQGIPGLSEIPILGRLFTNRTTQTQRTDLILTLTPHIIRTPDVTEEDLLPIWVGTEANITFRGGSPRVESDVEGPFDEEEGAEADRIREMIRRRIQNLPRGLRESAEPEAGAAEPEEAPGVDLVPPPIDPFQSGDGGAGSPQAALGPIGLDREVLSTGATVMSLMVAESDESGDGGAAAVEIALEPSKKRVRPGDKLEVVVNVTAREPVSHLPITLLYDPELLEVRRVKKGKFLGPSSEARVLVNDDRPGRIVIGASRLGRIDGVTGTGMVARIRFRALAEGRATVSFEKGRALDVDLGRITPLERTPAVIEVTGDDDGSGQSPPSGK